MEIRSSRAARKQAGALMNLCSDGWKTVMLRVRGVTKIRGGGPAVTHCNMSMTSVCFGEAVLQNMRLNSPLLKDFGCWMTVQAATAGRV